MPAPLPLRGRVGDIMAVGEVHRLEREEGRGRRGTGGYSRWLAEWSGGARVVEV